MRLAFSINPRKIAIILASLAFYFAIQSLVAEYLIENILNEEIHSELILIIDLFSVNAEETIPTWYATILLFLASIIIMVLAIAKFVQQDRYRYHWAGLAVLFFYLSIDEGAAIHEILSNILEPLIRPAGYLYFGWVIVAVPVVLLIGMLYLRFILHLPTHTRNLIILAGTIYVGGAIVFEAISANRWYLDGGQSFEYLAIATIEELAEMLGVVIFIYSLLNYSQGMGYSIILKPSDLGTDSGYANLDLSQITADQQRIKVHPPVRKLLIPILLIVAIANMALISWSLSQQPKTGIVSQHDQVYKEDILRHLETYDVYFTELDGQFSPANPVSLQEISSLLTDFGDVMIVTWSSSNTSIAIATNSQPLDRNVLAEFFHLNGETQFVIYNTNAIEAIVGNTRFTES